MAELLIPHGDTDRPWDRVGTASSGAHRLHPGVPVDDAVALVEDADAEPAEPAQPAQPSRPTEAIRPAEPVQPAEPAQPGEPAISVADLPEWIVREVDQVEYPSRMARRRALEAAAIRDGWEPDPRVTPPVLDRVQTELHQYPDDPDALAQVPPAGASSRRRTRRLVAAVAAGVVLLAGAGAFLTQRAHHGGRTPAAASTSATQQVIALALSQDGALTGVSLLAAGPSDSQQVLVPSRLLLDVPGAGRLPVAQSLGPGPSAPGAAIADALEIRVKGTWVLSRSALATLVDSVGGVTVDVDVDVPNGPAEGAAIVVPQGSHVRLDGTQAALYAQLLLGDEPEAVRLARQERVVTALLAAMPQDAARRRAVLVGLPGAPRGAVLDSVVSVTGVLRDAAAQGALASTVIPVREIDTGGAVSAYGLDTAAAAAMVSARLSGAAIAVPPGGRLRVLVQNGDGTPGLGDSARSKLVAAGLKYVGGGNVDGFGVAQTVVLIPDGSSANRTRALTVAHALGLKDSALRISDSAPTVADVVVVLGHDFKAS